MVPDRVNDIVLQKSAANRMAGFDAGTEPVPF